MKKRRCSTYEISLATLIVLSLVFFQYPSTQPAYAHTFSGAENAGFIATVEVIRTEIRLVDNTAATNASLANEHANFAVEHLSENDTKELSEKNERIGTDLPQYLSDLQNMTANLSPTNMTGITAIKQKVSDIDALLGEALTVRIEPAQLRNATVNAWALADLLNETLERYGEAIGIAENSSTSLPTADGNNSEVSTDVDNTTTTTTTTGNASTSNNTSTAIVNYAEYQSTQGLVNMTKEMLNEIKSLLGSNSSTAITADSSSTNTTAATTMGNATTTTTTNSSAISKVGNDLDELKTLIDNKSSYMQVATFVYDTIYPDLNSAFGLGLENVDVSEAIEEARSGEEEEE
jgi:hypothetical protein